MAHKAYVPPSEDTHFLVSGGGKGITAENVVALAKVYKSSFTLLGRSGLLTDEPEWAVGHVDEPELKQSLLNFSKEKEHKISPKELDHRVRQILSSREIKNTLQRIEEVGGSAQYIQADITNPEELEKQLSDVLSTIDALLHGAGTLADKYIEDKNEDDYERVYGVKVDGLKNLLNLLPIKQLSYLILFSSVAGFYGNAGQADYSLSNEILNKFAHYIKQTHPSCRVLAIDWGPWDGGMVSPQLRRILKKKNVRVISVEEGTDTLVELLSEPGDNPQWIVGNALPFPAVNVSDELKSYRISRQLSLDANPFLTDHVIGGNAVLPTVCAVSWLIHSCKSLYPGFQYHAINDYRVFKGIIFDNTLADEYLLELNEIEKTKDTILFHGKISSESPSGKLRNHYQAQVELQKKNQDRPRLSTFDLTPKNAQLGKSYYADKVLFHGPRFQGIQEVLNVSESGLTTRCNLKSFPANEQGQFPVNAFNPFMADVHLQSLLLWAHLQLGSIGLPLSISSGIQYEPISFDATSYATMLVKSSSKHKLVADVTSHDKDGNIFSQVTNAEITLNENLFDLFKENRLSKEQA